ncbi:3-hydroxyacyl-CoA dehydrogenase family protein [Aliiroseovarius crassostreae]|uniref:3-hydroxyacyl-CoA dehydrogenase family protein n=1 Tax=Aliiroseovarius crassostreae TaxID=154981 RepID=UPI003C7A648D
MKIGIVGAGAMGVGIAINCAINGHSVLLTDISNETLTRAINRYQDFVARQVDKGRLSNSEAKAALTRLGRSDALSELAPCEIVIEAVSENLPLKRQLFQELQNIVSGKCVLASNTSCLKLSDIAGVLKEKSRFCGLHYFNPAEINPVVELVATTETAARTLETMRAFLQSTKKTTIECKDEHGFALNRFFVPYCNEAARCLDEGLATAGQIDQVAREIFQASFGPFAVMNIVKTDIMLHAMRSLATLGPFYAEADGLERMGAGAQPWPIEDQPDHLPDPVAREIAHRLRGALLLPVAELLANDIASLEDIGLGAQLAFRMNRTPEDMLTGAGRTDALADVIALCERYGHLSPEMSFSTSSEAAT